MTPELSLQPIAAPSSIRAQVEQALLAVLVSGELGPGELISVPTLAAQFGVSATPVREAMIEMERRGFVEPVRNKGFRVTEVSDADLRRLAEVRQMLEPAAMAKLASSFPAKHAARLRRTAEQIVAGARSGDLRQYLEADRRFHLELTALLDNPVLTETIADLRGRTRMLGLHELARTEQLERSAAEHAQLLDLLEQGDAAGASDLMHRHIGHAVGLWAGHDEASV